MVNQIEPFSAFTERSLRPMLSILQDPVENTNTLPTISTNIALLPHILLGSQTVDSCSERSKLKVMESDRGGSDMDAPLWLSILFHAILGVYDRGRDAPSTHVL